MRVAAGQRRTILALLADLEADLLRQLERVAGKQDINAARLRALLAQTRDTIATSYGDISERHITELRKVADATAKATARTINTAVRVPIINVALTPEQLVAISGRTLIQGGYAKDWWKRQRADLVARFGRAMRLGYFQGESIDKLVQRVRGTRARGFTDGVMSVPRKQAEALVRTSVMAVANVARLQTLSKNADLIQGIQWVATMDSRTTPICVALDGLVWRLPESGDAEDYGGYVPVKHKKQFPGPTAHFSCRSTQVAVLKSFDDLKGKGGWNFATTSSDKFDAIFQRKLRGKGFTAAEAKKIHAETRASMDGQVGVVKGFDGWLNGKSDKFQDDLLGKRAAALWRAGKIDLIDLTDQSNRPLKASELA